MAGVAVPEECFTVETHPILSLLHGMDEGSINKKCLNQFIQFLEANKQAPSFQCAHYKTITSFMKKYIEYQIFNNPSAPLQKQFQILNKKLSMPDEKRKFFLKSLSQIAFMNLICGVNIKWNLLKEEFYLETSPIFSEFGCLEKYNPMRILKQLEGTQGKYWVFRERFVQEFLAACFQADKILGAIIDRKSHLLGRKLTRSLKMMPGTSDIWCMTFGLTSGHSDLCPQQVRLMSEVVGQLKIILKKFVANKIEKICQKSGAKYKYSGYKDKIKDQTCNRVTRFFIECTFESANKGQLIKHTDYFLTNETINYSGIGLSQNRIMYSLAAIGYFLATAQSVYGLHLPRLKIDQKNIKTLVEPLHSVSDNTLQVLNLGDNNLGQKGMETLFRFFVKASDLTHIDINNCSITDRGLVLFVQAFICMPLVFINLSHNCIGDQGIDHLSRNLCYLPSLEWLDLSDNSISSGAVHLASGMSSLSCLKYLNLGKNLIDDQGASAVAGTIESLKNIEVICFAENYITNIGSNALADHVMRSKSIRNLDVRFNKIPYSAVMRLKRAAKSQGSMQVSTREQRANPLPWSCRNQCRQTRPTYSHDQNKQTVVTELNPQVTRTVLDNDETTGETTVCSPPSDGSATATPLTIKDPASLRPSITITKDPLDDTYGRVNLQLSIALKRVLSGDATNLKRRFTTGSGLGNNCRVVFQSDKKDVVPDADDRAGDCGNEEDGDGGGRDDGKDWRFGGCSSHGEQGQGGVVTNNTTTTMLQDGNYVVGKPEMSSRTRYKDDAIEVLHGDETAAGVEGSNPGGVQPKLAGHTYSPPKPAPRSTKKWKKWASPQSNQSDATLTAGKPASEQYRQQPQRSEIHPANLSIKSHTADKRTDTSSGNGHAKLDSSGFLQDNSFSFLDVDGNVEEEKDAILSNISKQRGAIISRRSWNNISSYASTSFSMVDSIHLYDI